jgi:uncharacterized protein (DUF58 family)
VTATARRTFPLVPRRRLAGTTFGTQPSVRRGPGSDVAGSRPYRPGDRLSTVDWHASARLSAFRGSDEFVVRQTFADDAPQVLVVCDRRPAMALYPPGLPFVAKPAIVREAVTAVAASAQAARAELGWLDVGGAGTTWIPPRTRLPDGLLEQRLAGDWDGPPDGVLRALRRLARGQNAVPRGTFVFVVSDFLVPQEVRVWRRALARGLDLVPVIVQDPVWERSFPQVAGVLLPIVEPGGGRGAGLRLSRAQVRDLRAANERRARELGDLFESLGADVVELESPDPATVDATFALWAARRRRMLRLRELR